MELSFIQFQKSKDYLMQLGRPLDKAIFRFYFENGSQKDIIEELEYYQNTDGGFGRGLEADLRSENSSIIATYHAMEICRDARIDYSVNLVNNALRYIIDNYDKENKVWPIITNNVRDVPHPWWWQGDVKQTFNGFKFNPSAGILGSLFDYQDFVSKEIIQECLEEMISKIGTNYKGGIFEFRSVQFLINSKNFDKDLKEQVIRTITPSLKENLVTESSKWNGFNLNPTNIINSPSSPFVEIIGTEILQQNLLYDINNQLEDGSWPLNWSWEDIDPIGWKIAEREWKGHMTILKLKLFKEFNLIEN